MRNETITGQKPPMTRVVKAEWDRLQKIEYAALSLFGDRFSNSADALRRLSNALRPVGAPRLSSTQMQELWEHRKAIEEILKHGVETY
jgi:hypothetical protein